jgi:hypothetical protein
MKGKWLKNGLILAHKALGNALTLSNPALSKQPESPEVNESACQTQNSDFIKYASQIMILENVPAR